MTSSRGAMLLALALVTLARAEDYYYKSNPLDEQYYYKYTDVDTTYKPALGYNDDDAGTLRHHPPTAPASTSRTLEPQELADVKDALKMLLKDREVNELFPTALTDGDRTTDVITSWGTEVIDNSAKNALAMVLAQLDALEKTRSRGIPRRTSKASEFEHKQDIGVTESDKIRGWIPVRVKLHRDDTTVEYNGGYDSTETTTTTEPDANTETAFATEYKDNIIYGLNNSLDKIPATKFSDFKNNGQGSSNAAPKLKREHVTKTPLTRSLTASDTTRNWVPVDIESHRDVNGTHNDDYDTTEFIATTEPETEVILMYRDMTHEANRTIIEKQTKSLKTVTRTLNTLMDSLDEYYDFGNKGGGFRRGDGDESGNNNTDTDESGSTVSSTETRNNKTDTDESGRTISSTETRSSANGDTENATQSASSDTTTTTTKSRPSANGDTENATQSASSDTTTTTTTTTTKSRSSANGETAKATQSASSDTTTTTTKSRRRKTKTRKPKRRKTTRVFTYSSTTSKSRRRRTRTRSTSPTSTSPIPLDFPKLIELITNLTMDYSLNLTNLMNKTLQNMSMFTCPTETTTPMPTTTTTELTTTVDPYGNLTGTIMGKCFVCGLDEPMMPRHARCADAFSGDFIPLVPVDATARRMLASYRKYCRWMNVPKYVINETDPRSMWGRWTGGCSVRWIDISGIYTQRTCRNRHRAVMGRHWMSKRMAKLEMALQRLDNSCIISPMASLVPLSRGISLYARFHACVCTGSWCNRASPSPPCILHVATTLLVMFLFIS